MIDASIIGGLKPPQFENPVNALARVLEVQNAQQSNDLNRLKMDEYQRGVEETKTLADIYRGAYGQDGKLDRNALLSGVASRGLGAKIPALQKGLLETDELQGKVDKQKTELLDARLKQSRAFLETVSTPEDYIRWHEANHKDPVLGPALAAHGVTAETSRTAITEALKSPGGFEDLLNKSRLGIEKYTELNKPTFQTRNTGATTDTLQLPGLGGTPKVVNTIKNTQSPDSAASIGEQRRHNQKMEGFRSTEVAMGGKPPPGYRWNGPNLEAIPGGPGDKLPESQQKQVVGVNNLSNAIAEYRAQLKDYGKLDSLRPDARATMGTKYNNMMLQAKEAYNLGVLNGPDLEILTSVITDPRSLKGAVTSKEALDKQASELDRIMKKMGEVSGQARQPQNKPGGATGEWGGSNDDPLGIRGGR